MIKKIFLTLSIIIFLSTNSYAAGSSGSGNSSNNDTKKL